MFELRDIQFSYPGGEPMTFPDMQFDRKEEWLILGPSGCGKTTLLHLMCGLLKPTNGSISLRDTGYDSLSGYAMDKFRGKNIGIVFQQSHFLSSLTVIDNLLMAQNLAGKPKNKQKAIELLDRLGLSNRRNFLPNRLSIGEQQRVSIARSVINEPAVILADEPTSALDDENADHVLNLLQEQADVYDSTLIIVTHDTRLKEKINNKIELT